MRVLIFGGTGFCGFHLAKACLADGDEVFVTGRKPTPRLDELGGALKRFLPVEITRPEDIEEALRIARPERIYHLAGLASVARSLEAEEEVYRINVLGTFHVLKAIEQLSPEARILLIGSAEEYGPNGARQLPISEQNPTGPVSPYGISRLTSTLMGLRAARQKNLDLVVTRTFNLVGPHQSRTFVCSDFAAQIARGRLDGANSIEIHTGDLEVKRDFSSVRDGVAAYRALIEKGQAGTIYNVCSGQASPIKDILEKLAAAAKLRVLPRIDPKRLRKGEVREVRGDPTALLEATGLHCGSLDQALEDLLEYWLQKLA